MYILYEDFFGGLPLGMSRTDRLTPKICSAPKLRLVQKLPCLLLGGSQGKRCMPRDRCWPNARYTPKYCCTPKKSLHAQNWLPAKHTLCAQGPLMPKNRCTPKIRFWLKTSSMPKNCCTPENCCESKNRSAAKWLVGWRIRWRTALAHAGNSLCTRKTLQNIHMSQIGLSPISGLQQISGTGERSQSLDAYYTLICPPRS